MVLVLLLGHALAVVQECQQQQPRPLRAAAAALPLLAPLQVDGAVQLLLLQHPPCHQQALPGVVVVVVLGRQSPSALPLLLRQHQRQTVVKSWSSGCHAAEAPAVSVPGKTPL